jgi:hypothetical protein
MKLFLETISILQSISIETTGTTSAAGTAYPSGASAFTMVFCGVRVALSFLCFLSIFICSLLFLFPFLGL